MLLRELASLNPPDVMITVYEGAPALATTLTPHHSQQSAACEGRRSFIRTATRGAQPSILHCNQGWDDGAWGDTALLREIHHYYFL